MSKVAVGLKTLKMGAIAGDGGMGATLTTVGYTVADTCTLTTEEGQTTDFKVEEQDDPIYSIVSEKGKRTLNWSIYDVDVDVLVLFFGGTKTVGPPDVWDAPASEAELEKSIEIVTKNDWKVEIPRAKIVAKFQWNFQKTKLAQIDITATILVPTKANTAPIKITEPV